MGEHKQAFRSVEARYLQHSFGSPRGLKSPAIHHDVCPCPPGFCMQWPPLPMVSFSMSVLATSTVFSGPEGWLWAYCTEARPICVKQAGFRFDSASVASRDHPLESCAFPGLFGFTKHTKLCRLHALWALPRVISGGFLGVLF